jgi:MAF protein
VRRLALAKADSAGAAADHNEIVLAADTAVLNGDRILGKPADRAEAREMLQALRGREHRVLTAIALVDQASGERVVDVCETCVPMRAYGDAEVEAYVASGAVQDKAGAYGIQDHGFDPVLVDQMQGCYANVMGLPLCHLVRSMRRLGLEPPGDVPAACRAHTGYACSVYPGILGAEA